MISFHDTRVPSVIVLLACYLRCRCRVPLLRTRIATMIFRTARFLCLTFAFTPPLSLVPSGAVRYEASVWRGRNSRVLRWRHTCWASRNHSSRSGALVDWCTARSLPPMMRGKATPEPGYHCCGGSCETLSEQSWWRAWPSPPWPQKDRFVSLQI